MNVGLNKKATLTAAIQRLDEGFYKKKLLPQKTIKAAYAAGFITRGDIWLDMLNARNLSSPMYNEAQALLLEQKIRLSYADVLRLLIQTP